MQMKNRVMKVIERRRKKLKGRNKLCYDKSQPGPQISFASLSTLKKKPFPENEK